MRDRHYIPNKGSIARQLHYLVLIDGHQVGIISGASPTFSVGTRDRFFGLSNDPRQRGAQLKHILNNSVFRLEEHLPNLGTQVLACWRRIIARDYYHRYGSRLLGLETFIEPSECRHGALYRADNWSQVGLPPAWPARKGGSGWTGRERSVGRSPARSSSCAGGSARNGSCRRWNGSCRESSPCLLDTHHCHEVQPRTIGIGYRLQW
jgi:hypothetical protein